MVLATLQLFFRFFFDTIFSAPRRSHLGGQSRETGSGRPVECRNSSYSCDPRGWVVSLEAGAVEIYLLIDYRDYGLRSCRTLTATMALAED